jgi:hypothetical protein
VDDPFLVSFLEGLGDLLRDQGGLVDGKRASLQPLGDVLALDQLEDEHRPALGLLHAVDGRDVRMVEGGEELGLARSRAKRSGSDAISAGSTLSATSRPSSVSVAR